MVSMDKGLPKHFQTHDFMRPITETWRSLKTVTSKGFWPCHWCTEIWLRSLNLLIILCTVEGEIPKILPIWLLFVECCIICWCICWQIGEPQTSLALKGLGHSWTLLVYCNTIASLVTLLLVLNCHRIFFWHGMQKWISEWMHVFKNQWSCLGTTRNTLPLPPKRLCFLGGLFVCKTYQNKSKSWGSFRKLLLFH